MSDRPYEVTEQAALRADIAELRRTLSALLKFARHQQGCIYRGASFSDSQSACNCGLAELFAERM